MIALVFSLLFAAKGPLWMAASTEKKILVVRVGNDDVKKYDIAVGTRVTPRRTAATRSSTSSGIRRGFRLTKSGRKARSRPHPAIRRIPCGR
jgi:hypothetical protein